MKKVLFIVGMVLSVSAVAYVLHGCNGAVSAASATAPATPAALMALATAEPTMQPTFTAAPTIDQSVPMTQNAIDHEAANNAKLKADAGSTQISNTATVQALAIIAGQFTQTQVAINLTSTPEAARAQALIIANQNAAKAQKEQDDIKTRQMKDDAARQSFTGWALTILVIVAALGVVAIIVIGVVKMSRTPGETPVTPNKAEQTTAEYLQEKVDIQTSQPNQAFDNPLEINRIELARLQSAAIEFGGVLSRRKLMKHGFTQARADELCKALQYPAPDNTLFADPGSNSTTVLTEAGWKLIKAAPTPPQWDEPPETSENAGKS